MRTEHLEYFLNLAQTGSITQTSKELFTTHQNVSKIIRQLENDLGTTLFIRTQKGVTLSATGKMLLSTTQHVFEEFNQLRSNIHALEKSKNLAGELYISGSEMSNTILLSTLIPTFAELHPNLHIHLNNETPSNVLKKVALHPEQIGITVVLSNPDFQDLYVPYINYITLTPLLQDTYFCVTGNESPLNKLNAISLTQFAQQPCAIIASADDEEDALVKLIKKYGGSVAFSSNNTHSHLQALQSGYYVGFSSSRAHQKIMEANPKNTSILIPFKENMQFSISLVTNQHPTLSEAAQVFADFLQANRIYL